MTVDWDVKITIQMNNKCISGYSILYQKLNQYISKNWDIVKVDKVCKQT